MEQELSAIVTKMFELDFRDDKYRNESQGNKLLGLQYFYKRHEGSDWEVFASYNPNSSLLSLQYYNVYKKEPQYPVFFITIEDAKDAETACKLLEMKTNYLWAKSIKTPKHSPESISSALNKIGFENQGNENNIATWVHKDGDNLNTLLVENSVSLSIYLFCGDPKGKARPLMALRNIGDKVSFNEALSYAKRKV